MSRNYATTKFGIGTAAQDLRPYFKFSWSARFEFADGSGDPLVMSSMTLKTCELPRWTADTQVVNVYNHKTIVQTRLNYEPITMSFYDQQNDAVETMLWDFVKGQFDPTNGSKTGTIKPMTITIKMHKYAIGGTDLDETLESTDDPSKEKIYILENAYIVDAQHDTLDYSTSDTVLWTLTVRYEKLTWVTGFEGEAPTMSTGIAATPTTAPTRTSPPVPASKPIPDADVGVTQMEVEFGIGPDGQYSDAAYSKERPSKSLFTPGSATESVYAGKQSAVSTADVTLMEAEYGIGADGGYSDAAYSPSTGRASATQNTGSPTSSRTTNSGVTAAAAAARTAEPKAMSSTASGPSNPSLSSRYKDVRDGVQARRRNMTLKEYRESQTTTSNFKNVRIQDF